MKHPNSIQCIECQQQIYKKNLTWDKLFDIYFCQYCQVGYTYPIPKDMGKYYLDTYWINPGLTGVVKDLFYNIFQRRRKMWIEKLLSSGKILDIGSGEGLFGKFLPQRYRVTSLDPSTNINNPKVIKKDFLKWSTHQKFDAIVFWESLEHTSNPSKYIKKAFSLLNKNGVMIIEYPRYDSLESKLFSRNWFHLDPPRHLVHLTKTGLKKILEKYELHVISSQSVLAPEYSLGGFIASILSQAGFRPRDFFKKEVSFFYLILLFPLLITAIVWQACLLLFNQSPIAVVIARKDQ